MQDNSSRWFWIEFVAWFALFISSVGIQYADSKIGEFQRGLDIDLARAANYEQLHMASKLTAEMAVFKQFLPYNQLPPEQIEKMKKAVIGGFNKQFHKLPEFKTLYSKLEKGEITLREFYSEIVKLQSAESKRFLNQYNHKMKTINETMKIGTKWNPIKTWLFYIHSFVIVVLGYGYFRKMHDNLKNHFSVKPDKNGAAKTPQKSPRTKGESRKKTAKKNSKPK